MCIGRHQFLPLAVKTVFLAAAELSAEDVLVIVGDLNETVPAPLDVVSGPGAVDEQFAEKVERKSPGMGTLSVLAAAAAITDAGGADETANSEEVDLSEM